MFKPSGFICFSNKNGSQVVASTPSLALVHWHSEKLRRESDLSDWDEMPVVSTKVHVPMSYQKNFLVSVIGCIERIYGTSPEIDDVFFDFEWYNNLTKPFDSSDPKVVIYENACMSILKWLSDKKDIVNFQI